MINMGRELLQTQFSVPSMVDRLLEVYKGALQNDSSVTK